MSSSIIQNVDNSCNSNKKRHILHSCAINLARAGIRLHPLPAGDKAPPITSWQKIATTDLAKIDKWFAGGKHNIGVITGEQIDVVDFDHNETYEQYADKLQDYFTVKTRRGYHVYVAPTGLKNKVGKGENKDIDLRGEGGYVVGPRSIIKDGDDIREYLPLPFCTLDMLKNPKPAPKWLINILDKETTANKPAASPSQRSVAKQQRTSNDVDAYISRSLKILADEISSAPEGSRNHTLNRCALRGYRVAMAAEGGIEVATSMFADAALRAGLANDEITKTLSSARDKARKEGVALPATPLNIAPAAPSTTTTIKAEPEKKEETELTFDELLASFADDKGRIKYSAVRAGLLLKAYGVSYDTFLGEYMVNGKVFDDNEKALFMAACESGGMLYPVGKQYINQPLWFIEKKHDWLIQQVEALPKWDKVGRIQGFFAKYCGAEDNEFNKQASLYLWTSLIGRMLATEENPCKADVVIILQGAQGTRKTTLTHALCLKPELWSSFNFDMREDEIKRRIRCSCVVEVPELTGFSRKDVTNIKQFFGESVDQFRPLYQERRLTIPRRCVFIMTTNESCFLKDSTGERRFAPVQVGKINIEAVQKDLLQLYAEALVAFKHNNQGVMWQGVEALQEEHNEQFKEENPLQDVIMDWIEMQPNDSFRTADIVIGALQEQPARVHLLKKNVGNIMESLGYTLSARKRVNGHNARFWEKIRA